MCGRRASAVRPGAGRFACRRTAERGREGEPFDGWIDIFVVTQAGEPDPDFDASVPSVNYDLSLHTKPNHLDADLRVFRTVLQMIRLSSPPPPSARRPVSSH